MVITNITIPSSWDGNLQGIMIKSDNTPADDTGQNTKRIMCIHGWRDNLNSFLWLAQRLINDRPNYEIFAYDRAGHGLSDHHPKGCEYSIASVVRDIRTVVLYLGWDKHKFSIIGHSYGGVLGISYAACYQEEVDCLVSMDTIPAAEVPYEDTLKTYRSRIESSLEFHEKQARLPDPRLTPQGFLQLIKLTRPGVSDGAAKLLMERSVRRDADNKLRITFDEAAKILPLYPYTDDLARTTIQNLKTSTLVLFSSKCDLTKYQKSIEYFKEYTTNFELAFVDGPHDFHLTNVKDVVDLVEAYFDKYLK